MHWLTKRFSNSKDSLVWVSPAGAVDWKTKLGPDTILDPFRSAPAIGENGDIYVAWTSYGQQDGLQFWLSRVSSDGSLLWVVPSHDEVDWSSPALVGDRIVLSHDNGYVSVYDTTGAIVWERDFDASANASSPVIDEEGNIYVQTWGTLISYDRDGALRWSSASLSSGNPPGVGAPALLADGSLVVACRHPGDYGEDLCAIDRSDGSLLWRIGAADEYVKGAPAVATDGTIYVTIAVNLGRDLVALWGRSPPLGEGWPTEGGGMGRMRSRN